MNFLHEIVHLLRSAAAAPVNLFVWLWSQPRRGRCLLAGMPAILAFLFVLIVSILVRTSLRNELSNTYVEHQKIVLANIETLRTVMATKQKQPSAANATLTAETGSTADSKASAARLAENQHEATARDQVQMNIRSVAKPATAATPQAAAFLLELTPDGRIEQARLIASSGDPTWDDEVERGILRTRDLEWEADDLPPPTLVVHFDRAEFLLDREQAELQVYLRKLIELKPNDATYKFELALSFYRTGDFLAATSLMEQIAPLDRPGLPAAHRWLATQWMMSPRSTQESQQTRINRALKHLSLALQADPNNVGCNVDAAKLYALKGQYGKALELVNRVFDTASKKQSLQVTQLMVDLYRRTNQIEVLNERLQEVEKRLEELKEADSTDERYWLDLSRVYEYRGMYAKGVEKLNELKQKLEKEADGKPERLNPELADYYVRWGKYLVNQGEQVDPTEILEKFAKALEIDPGNERALIELADLGAKPNPLREQALRIYDPMQDLDHAPPTAIRQIATARIIDKKYDEAMMLLERAIARAPRDPITANNLAYLLLASDPPDPQRALQLVNVTLKNRTATAQLDADLIASLLDTRASAYMLLERYHDAIADWQYAIQLKPDKRKFLEFLRDAYQAAQLPELAANVQRQIEREAPVSPPPTGQ